MFNYSLIVPIYKNEENIPSLIKAIRNINDELGGDFEVVFVVDGSPDNSYQLLSCTLSKELFRSKLLLLSRNFGSFSAIKAGLKVAKGEFFCVMAADLQEPPELAVEVFKTLRKREYDVVVGKRLTRKDPPISRALSGIFWWLYRKFVISELPKGGVDMFGCNCQFRNDLIRMEESNTSLIGQIYWLGYKRKEISYERKERVIGKSAWTFSKKLRYMMDSIYAFTDLPIKVITVLGFLGVSFFSIFGFATFIGKLLGLIDEPGYTTISILVGFFGSLNLIALGVVGSYTWRTYENSKSRAVYIIKSQDDFNADKQ